MKKHFSVFALWAQGVFWHALAVIGLMAAAELLAFRVGLGRVADGAVNNFIQLTKFCRLSLIFSVALGVLTVRLLIGVPSGELALGKLGISGRWAALWQAAVNFAWLVILWASQAALVLVGFALYAKTAPQAVNGQSLVIAAYNSPFLHMVFPLRDGLAAAVGVSALAALAVTLALDAHRLRLRRRFPFSTGIMGALAILEWAVGNHATAQLWWYLAGNAAILTVAALGLCLGRGEGTTR